MFKKKTQYITLEECSKIAQDKQIRDHLKDKRGETISTKGLDTHEEEN